MNAELVVGATAIKVELRLPYPLVTFGSPNFLANSSDAFSDFSRIVLNRSSLSKLASTDSKGIICDCSNECHPKTPSPNALLSTAKL